MQIIWLCLKMGYTPQMVILMGIMIIGGFMAFKQTHIYILVHWQEFASAAPCLVCLLVSQSAQPTNLNTQPTTVRDP